MSIRSKRICTLGLRNTPLHTAIANNEYETVLKLLSQPETNLNKYNVYGDTPLLYSIKRHKSRCISALIDHGCDVNIPNEEGETPLHFAASGEDYFVTNKLIEKGAEINAKDCDGKTPLHNAVRSNRIENVQVLLYYGACADEKDLRDETPFMMALDQLGRNSSSSEEISRYLLNYVVDLNERNYCEGTPLYRAILGGSTIALDIINRGANVNQIVRGEHCINTSLEFYTDNKVFRAIWYRLNVNILLKTEYLRQTCFLRVFFYKSRLPDEDFLECLYMIFESPKIDVFVERFYRQDSDQTSDLMYHISKNRLPHRNQNEEVKIASLLLSHGFEICFKDVAGLYEKYGFSTCVDLLLNNGSAIHQSESVTDYYDYRSLKVELIASKLCYDNFHIYSKVPDTQLEVDKHEIRHFRKFYKAHFDFDEIPHLENRHNSNRFYTVIEVPSLVQLSRDFIRTVLYKKFSSRDYFKVYQKISDLCVPEVMKDILRLKKPIYYDIEDQVCVR